MRILDLGRYVSAICAALSILVGCGEPQSAGAPGAFAPTTALAPTHIIGRRVLPAVSFQVLHRFRGGSDGAQPTARLLDVNDTMFGTTTSGGGTGCSSVGCGTVYTITPNHVETVLHSFSGGLDGWMPAAGLSKVNGTLYGTTRNGGGSCNCGTVYSISVNGLETVLHRFQGGVYDGFDPAFAGVTNIHGTLYGTTFHGGGASACGAGCGIAYSLNTATGAFTILHRFIGGSDGFYPTSTLLNVNGTLYGTTVGGGSSCDCGLVYTLSTNGTYKVLYNFNGGTDGWEPDSDLVDVNGILYGTTLYGGGEGCSYGAGGCGTVYSIGTSGAEKVVYSFRGGSDGAIPGAGLHNLNGTLYGVTSFGGGTQCTHGCGTVYSLTTTGVEKVVHAFAGGREGVSPDADLIDLNGVLYGTTAFGPRCIWSEGCGIVFGLSP
ncbi:MAG: choice-of-anchor tandem repeat GloVer-containing protein [Candidatus Cybelea sp.]